MVSGLCPSSVVRVAIISEPIEQVPFKVQLWLPLGNSLGHHFQHFQDFFFRFRVNHVSMGPYCLGFLEFGVFDFSRFFFVVVNMEPHGR